MKKTGPFKAGREKSDADFILPLITQLSSAEKPISREAILEKLGSNPGISVTEIEKFLRSNWSKISREAPKSLPIYKELAPIIFALYANTFFSELCFFILGGPSLRFCDPSATKKEIKNVRALLGNLGTCSSKEDGRGSVLFQDTWGIIVNDYWVLAAIHSGKEFHLYTDDGEAPPKSLVWEEKERRPRVLGRELLILKEAGYVLIHTLQDSELV